MESDIGCGARLDNIEGPSGEAELLMILGSSDKSEEALLTAGKSQVVQHNPPVDSSS